MEDIKTEQESCTLRVKALFGDSQLPYSKDPLNSGVDLFVHRWEDCGNHIKVFSGVSVQPSSGYYFFLAPRSSTYKYGLTLYNNLGIIDQNYTGEIIGIFLKTDSYSEIKKGDRIMQLIPQKVIGIEPEWAEDLSSTERGEGGFGSSGK